MAKVTNMEVRVQGGKKKLFVTHGSNTDSIALETPKEANINSRKRAVETSSRHKLLFNNRANALRDIQYSSIETLSGKNTLEQAKPISLKTLITICTTTTITQHYKLGMGIAGQMKIIIHNSASSSECFIHNVKTRLDSTTKFQSVVDGTSGQETGKVLILICDGTYWNPLGNVAAHADFPGLWEIA